MPVNQEVLSCLSHGAAIFDRSAPYPPGNGLRDQEGDRGGGSVRHVGPRAPAGRPVRPHLPQRSAAGGPRDHPLVEAEVQQLDAQPPHPRPVFSPRRKSFILNLGFPATVVHGLLFKLFMGGEESPGFFRIRLKSHQRLQG